MYERTNDRCRLVRQSVRPGQVQLKSASNPFASVAARENEFWSDTDLDALNRKCGFLGAALDAQRVQRDVGAAAKKPLQRFGVVAESLLLVIRPASGHEPVD